MNIRIVAVAALALGLSACTSSGLGYRQGGGYQSQGEYRSDTRCRECGVVERIESYAGDRSTSGGGAVAGAVVGGLLGSQVGKGDGRKAATVVGAVAGGFAGNAIERDRQQTLFEISVRMDDGDRLTVRQYQLDGVREGSRVFVRNGRAQLR